MLKSIRVSPHFLCHFNILKISVKPYNLPLATMSSSASSPIPLRILLLHGYTQSGPLFSAKSSSLRKSLQKAFPSPISALQLSYPSGPIPLSPSDIPGYDEANHTLPDSEPSEPEAFGWWRRKDPPPPGPDGKKEPIVYQGIERGMERLAETIRNEGPFDGVIGFSQGSAAAAILASLLEVGRPDAFAAAREKDEVALEYPSSFWKDGSGKQRIQEPLKFAVCYSGFCAPGPVHVAFYSPKIETPTLHVIGALDTVVEEERSRLLVEACEEGEGRRVLVHPGGHFLPGGKVWVEGVVGFIRDAIEGRLAGGFQEGKKGEERVEDMDVPF